MRLTDITTTNPTPINITVDPTTDIVHTPSAIRMAANIDIKRRLTSTHSEAASVGGLVLVAAFHSTTLGLGIVISLACRRTAVGS